MIYREQVAWGCEKMKEDTLIFECMGFGEDGKFFLEHTGRGEDISPEFLLKNLSAQAKSLAITLEDLSHPIKNFTHWVAWNIPAVTDIPKGIPAGASLPSFGNAVQGIGYGFHRYAGPKPPKGTSHRYRFTVYVLDCKLELPPCSTKRQVLRRAGGHIIQQGEICGYFV